MSQCTHLYNNDMDIDKKKLYMDEKCCIKAHFHPLSAKHSLSCVIGSLECLEQLMFI